MSDSYTSSKIKEALVASQGSRARAQDILLGWAQADDRLLSGLVEPYLRGIVTGTIERMTKPAAEKGAGTGSGAGRESTGAEAGTAARVVSRGFGESALHDGAGNTAAAPQSSGRRP
jgi:hypothetical protein